MLQVLHHGHIEVAVNLIIRSHLMDEEAPLAVGAEVLLMELFAILGLILLILGGIFKHELHISMSELTL